MQSAKNEVFIKENDQNWIDFYYNFQKVGKKTYFMDLLPFLTITFVFRQNGLKKLQTLEK